MPLWQPAQTLSRPAYYDRKAVVYAPGYTGIVAPHGLTERFSYTPPVGRAAFVELCHIWIQRVTAAAPLLYSIATLVVAPGGGAGATIQTVIQTDNTLYKFEVNYVNSLGYVAAGDTIKGYTADTSTGGTCQYNEVMKVTEFLY